MFTEEDFRKQVAEMKAIEDHMADYYSDLVGKIEDEDLGRRFESLMKAEINHSAQLDAILQMVESRDERGK